VAEGLVRSEQEATTALASLFEPRFAEQAKGTSSAGGAAGS
jgi:sulfonate transport system substrate-binding protein